MLRNAVISFKLLTRPRKVPFTADGIIDCSAPITVIPATAIEPSSSALKETFVRARGQGSHWSVATSPHRILYYATTSVGLRVTAWDTPYPPGSLEGWYLPTVDRIVRAARKTLR